MLPIWFLFKGLVFVAVFLLPGAAFRRCMPDIFIPGMLIPCMLLISCFFAVCFFRVVFLFFRVVGFDLDFDFGLLMPGILDISCWAKTGTLAKSRKAANKNAHTLTHNLKLNGIVLFIIPLLKNLPRKDVFRRKDAFSRKQTDLGF